MVTWPWDVVSKTVLTKCISDRLALVPIHARLPPPHSPDQNGQLALLVGVRA